MIVIRVRKVFVLNSLVNLEVEYPIPVTGLELAYLTEKTHFTTIRCFKIYSFMGNSCSDRTMSTRTLHPLLTLRGIAAT